MASNSQIEANRANSQRSTGPKTPEGKAAAAQNATSHGLSKPEIYVQPGEEDEFRQFEANLESEYKPSGNLQRQLFQTIVHAAWNIRRCRLLEVHLQNEANSKGLIDPLLDDTLSRQLDRLLRYQRAAERRERDAIKDLRKLQTEWDYRRETVPHLADDFSHLTDTMRLISQFRKEARQHGDATQATTHSHRNLDALIDQALHDTASTVDNDDIAA